jgi:uncharacterized membrane protein YsdA (DUF1294 family)/cold shock CspA family protein
LYTDGKIVRWDDEKGFGFAQTKDSGKDIFVHISEFESSTFRPVVNQKIRFLLECSPDGKLQAQSIEFSGKKLQKKAKRRGLFVPLVLLVFIAFIITSITNGQLPALVGYYYLLLSCISYLTFKWDKRAAQQGNWRISERALQLQSLLGGWPGAWYAQVNLSHKSQKRSFKWLFYLTVLINLGGLAWLFTEQGNVLVHSLAINFKFHLLGLLSYLDFIQFWWWKLSTYLSSL